MLKTPLGRFRFVAIAEGLSYLALFGVTMPLKYMAQMPTPNKVVGLIHGVLSVLYVCTLLHVWWAERWSVLRVVVAFVASLVPFGAFAFEWSLRREKRRVEV